VKTETKNYHKNYTFNAQTLFMQQIHKLPISINHYVGSRKLMVFRFLFVIKWLNRSVDRMTNLLNQSKDHFSLTLYGNFDSVVGLMSAKPQ